MLYNFRVITLSSVVGGKWGTRPEEKALEAHQFTLFRHLKNVFFSRNLGQNILKNAYFLEKSCKIAAASGDPPPKIPAGLQRLRTSSSDPRVVTLTY